MGQNLILNAADHGFTVVAFNRTVEKVPKFLENEAKGPLPNRVSKHETYLMWLTIDILQASRSLALSRSRNLS